MCWCTRLLDWMRRWIRLMHDTINCGDDGAAAVQAHLTSITRILWLCFYSPFFPFIHALPLKRSLFSLSFLFFPSTSIALAHISFTWLCHFSIVSSFSRWRCSAQATDYYILVADLFAFWLHRCCCCCCRRFSFDRTILSNRAQRWHILWPHHVKCVSTSSPNWARTLLHMHDALFSITFSRLFTVTWNV